MEIVTLSYNPVLIMVAVLLSIIAVYTALDLFTLLKSSERNKRFLFLGGTFSMGIGIWILHFIGMLSAEYKGGVKYEFTITVLSMIIGIFFSGAAFMMITGKRMRLSNLVSGTFFLTMAVMSIHMLGMYSINLEIQYNWLLMAFALIVTFGLFLFSLWVLFYSNIASKSNRLWVKPLSALLMTGAVVQGHFLFMRAATFLRPENLVTQQLHSQESIIIYLVVFVGILIVAGLLGSSAILNSRLAESDTDLEDIKSALDVSAIVAITNPQGAITYVNDKFCEISKYEEHELIGQDHSILNSGYHSKEFFKDLWKTIGQGEIWKGEIRNKAKDGSHYWVDTTIVPFLNKKGRPYQYVAIRNDITQRKFAEESVRNTLKDIKDIKFALDQSSIIAFTDEKGIITNVNDKFCEISRYSRDELIGEDHRILNSGYHSKEFFQELWRTIGHGEVWKGDIRNKAKDGSYYWVHTTIIPFLNDSGKPYQYLAIRTDITDQKKQEELLHRQDKLAAVGQLAAGVAHEIRNPLTSMRGYAEFLQMEEMNAEKREFLNIILEEIERVNDIVEEFMVMAKPKASTLKNRNIVPILKSVVSLMRFEARKKNVKLHFNFEDEIIQVECDENRLKQVFVNLVKNGIEAMPGGGEIFVKIAVKEEDVEISIQDTGVGIPPEKLKKIGEPFFTTKESGNGLGLMVSFKIIESHNGKVYVESELNKGTTFNIVLPKTKKPA
ncbi:PAS domain-containing protein [Bacillus marinisedimentorum]|uniref:PAS domain-containing protein n=1 Tax=Bacillus marinisedimentorum TaxID=1821260 RepID=UPI000871ED53|nr:PAS domain-containing protein [Bacillus marinisedimentorum]